MLLVSATTETNEAIATIYNFLFPDAQIVAEKNQRSRRGSEKLEKCASYHAVKKKFEEMEEDTTEFNTIFRKADVNDDNRLCVDGKLKVKVTCNINSSVFRFKRLTYAKLIEIKLLYLQKRHGLHEYVGKMESNDTPHGFQFGSFLL